MCQSTIYLQWTSQLALFSPLFSPNRVMAELNDYCLFAKSLWRKCAALPRVSKADDGRPTTNKKVDKRSVLDG